ncbi:hypothetical protein CLV37_105143 [Kineococcus rhizosphaerae]|uniref:Membrane associated rhomboid family serine protease n=1 Tax=Kineococcus rhizosphaerae TaxID=559628 RepID=A0A2T0R4B9_9ACTN|nr:hypothetical protein CLV37_105143 [Kineococcus rhizosphaerae]
MRTDTGAVRTLLRPGWLSARGTDLAVLYVLTVLVVFVGVHRGTPREQYEYVQGASTNVDNLRHSPFRVLVASSVVIPHATGLVILLPLVVALVAVQRWLGRLATIVVFGVGHVGATLFVAVVIAAGLTHGRLDPGVAHAPDVGVSYGMACLFGLLAARVPRRPRFPYCVLPVAGLVAVLLIAPDFTAVGHLVAFVVGLGLAQVAHRAATSAVAAAAAGGGRDASARPVPARAQLP